MHGWPQSNHYVRSDFSRRGAGEKAQWLEVLIALAEDPGLDPSTYKAAGISSSSSRGSDASSDPVRLLPPGGTHTQD